MSRKPLALVQIDDLAKHVQSTLRRCPARLGDSLIRQTGGLLSHCLRQHLRGSPAHPGMQKMALMGRCSERTARRNLRQLEAWRVMVPIGSQKGGRRAPRYIVDLEALKRALVMLGCNPSPELFEKIHAAMRLSKCDIPETARADMRADMRADICPDMMSAGIYIYTGDDGDTVVPFEPFPARGKKFRYGSDGGAA